MKTLIVAHEFRHAEHYAKYVLHLQRSAWTFVVDHWLLQGISQCEVIIVEAPRHRPTTRQLENRVMINILCEARRLPVKRVTLP